MLSNNMNTFYPKQIGLAVDPLLDPYAGVAIAARRFYADQRILPDVAEALLLFPIVVLPADFGSIRKLYEYFTVDDLKPFVETGRLRFCAPGWGGEPPRGMLHQGSDQDGYPWPDSLARLLSFHVNDCVQSKPTDIADQVGRFSLPQRFSVETMSRLEHEILELFGQTAVKVLPQPRDDPAYHFFIFRQHVLRMLCLWARGVLSTHVDQEFGAYLTLCRPGHAETESARSHVAIVDTVNALHSAAHLPTLTAAVAAGEIEKEGLLRLLQSDEAANLREWLHSHLHPGMDVRDAYYGTLGDLPSKKKWITWLRFGVTSSVGTAVGFTFSGQPIIAALLGIAAGVADVAVGDKVAEMFDPYHPTRWLSFLSHELNRIET